MAYWQLFIDESGSFEFDQAQRGSVVAGLLVRGHDTFVTRGKLRESLTEVYPRVPYPPHAATLNVPASRAAFDLYLPRPTTAIESQIRERCTEAVTALRNADAPSVGDVVRRAESPVGFWEPPDQENEAAMHTADAWLVRKGFRARSKLCELVDEQDLAITETLRTHCQTLLAATQYTVVGAWGIPRSHHEDSDLYLDLLKILLERVVLLLQTSGNSATSDVVWVHVAPRRIRSGSNQPKRLSLKDLQPFCSRARRVRMPGTTRKVELVFHDPGQYRSSVHPGVVLAEYIANRLGRRILSIGNRSWRDVIVRANRTLGLPLGLPSPGAEQPLPTCIANGKTLEAIHAVMRGRPLSENLESSGEPRWAIEQARLWINAIARNKGGHVRAE